MPGFENVGVIKDWRPQKPLAVQQAKMRFGMSAARLKKLVLETVPLKNECNIWR